MHTARVEVLTWDSPQLRTPKPDSFPPYYPPASQIPGLAEAVKRLGGGNIEVAFGYGSVFSGVADRRSLMDVMVVVENPWSFYTYASRARDIKLGTVNDAGFHAVWNNHKVNFYLGNIVLNGDNQGIKLAVMGHDQFLKHARGGRVDAMEKGEGDGCLYLSGRLHKILTPIFEDTTPEKKLEIDLAINQARIDGVRLAIGLVPQAFFFDQLATQYVDLSYAADRRVEKANKSLSLLERNYADYKNMLTPILGCFEESGAIRHIEGEVYEKIISLEPETVREWLKTSAAHAARVNYGQNIWTMGILNAAGYAAAKVLRAFGKQ